MAWPKGKKRRKYKKKVLTQEQQRAIWRLKGKAYRLKKKQEQESMSPIDEIIRDSKKPARQHKSRKPKVYDSSKEIAAQFDRVEAAVNDLTVAARNDEMKGDGDPLAMDVIAAQLTLAEAEFACELGILKRLVGVK